MKILPYVLIAPFVVLVVVSLVRLVYFGQKFNRLLNDKYPAKAKWLGTIRGFGPGCSNPFRSLPFLFSKEDFGDKELFHLKIKYRNAGIYLITGIPALGITIDLVIKHLDKLR